MDAAAKKKLNFYASQTVYQMLLIFLSAIFLFPLVWMICTSLKTSEEVMLSSGNVFQNMFPRRAQFSNYSELFIGFHFFRYLFNSLGVVVLNVAGTLISSSLVAYAFARMRWPGRDFWFWILLTTMMLPMHVTMIPTFLIYSRLRMVNSYIPLFLPAFLGGGAFNIFMLKQFYRSIPNDLSESAKIDGCGEIGIWLKIVLPLCLPVLATVAIFTFMFSWNDYLTPLIYISSPAKLTIALAIRDFQGKSISRWELTMAASVLSMIPTLILFIFCQKYFVEGIKLSGLKG